MQDPSQGVPQALLPHVHLISCYRYPFLASLPPENALEHLLNAPKVVKDIAPMAWMYLTAPSDGSVFLTWQPPSRQVRFASDGYVWADPEASYQLENRGYTLEILVHRCGYRPGEPVAAHARQRYRIISKPPEGAPTDASLWLVHYSQAEPRNQIPVNRIPPQVEVQRMMGDRRYLESQGQLIRKDFMLHDRPNWPTVTFANPSQVQGQLAQSGGMYGGNAVQHMVGRHPQYLQNQGGSIGPSPAKRPRQVPPSQLPGAPGPGASGNVVGVQHDPALEDEDTSLGDFLDLLTPREISTTRYTQHHEWLEEVFSSPYAAGQILPIDLGFGLTGDLAGLTDGLFDTPSSQSTKPGHKPSSPAPQYRRLEPAQLETFQTRVSQYLEKCNADIEKMRLEHASSTADLERGKIYMNAERRLRDAICGPSEGQRDVRPPDDVFPLDLDNERGAEEMTTEIVRDVERTLGVTVSQQENVMRVEKGGLVEERPEQVNGEVHEAGANSIVHASETSNAFMDDNFMDGDNTAAGLLDQFGVTSMTSTPAANQATSHVSRATSQQDSAAPTPAVITTGQPLGAVQESREVQPLSDMQHSDLSLTEGMDLDVDMSGIAEPNESKVGEDDWVMVGDGGNDDSGKPEARPDAPGDEADNPVSSEPPVTTAAPAGSTPGMFDSSDFGNFADLDTAGDALADFTGGDDELGLDMDNSAFGEAFDGAESGQDGADRVAST